MSDDYDEDAVAVREAIRAAVMNYRAPRARKSRKKKISEEPDADEKKPMMGAKLE